LEDPDVDRSKNIKMDLGEVGMGWIDLGQTRERWQTVVNAVMNLRFS
jgi:hypothetical protein